MTLRAHIIAPLMALSLASCATTGTGGINPATLTAILNATTAACGFLPTVEVVIAILGGGSPGLQTAAQVAAAICAAVKPPVAPAGVARLLAAPRAAPAPTVGGVRIDGKFVR